MTLTEFLLARIAEDERGWRETVGRRAALTAPQERLKAECLAKRQIVTDAIGAFANNVADPPDWIKGQRSTLYRAICALAQVYADHEDYRDEWKP